MRRTPVLISILISAGVSAHASVQASPIDIDRKLYFKHLSVNEGLSQNSVTDFTRREDGMLMISTYDGLNFYDGYEIKSVRHTGDNPNGLFNNRVTCMLPYPDGKVWLGMDGGVARYDPRYDTYQNYTDSLGMLQSCWVASLCHDNGGNLWIGTRRDLVFGECLQGGGFRFQTVANFPAGWVDSINRDLHGRIWVCSSMGLFVFDGGGDNELSFREIEHFNNIRVSDILFDLKGNIWVGTENGLELQAAGSGDFKKVALRGSENFAISCLAQDSRSVIWVGSGEGLSRVETNSGRQFKIAQYTNADIFGALSDNWIQALMIDPSNVLWIGTRNGINYADLTLPRLFTFKTPSNNPSDFLPPFEGYINAMLLDSRNKLWICVYQKSILVYDLTSGRVDDITATVTRSMISKIIEARDGTLWLAARESVYRVTRTGERGYRSERVFTGVSPDYAMKQYQFYTDICEDSYGNIWIATIQGLVRLDPATGSYCTYTIGNGLASDSAFSLWSDIDSNTVWVGSPDNGLTRIIYTVNDILPPVVLRKKGTKYTLSHDQVWCVTESADGRVWVGTDSGLNVIELKGMDITSSRHVNLPYIKDAKVDAITEDAFGKLWLNSSQGLYCYDPEDGSVAVYRHEDGLRSNTCTSAACRVGEWLFVGTINGINYFNPSLFVDNAYIGSPIITDLKVLNSPIAPLEEYEGKVLLDRGLNHDPSLVLNYTQNSFTVGFTSDHYAAPEKNRFRYMLEEYDKRWIEKDARERFASYENIPSGKYLFRLLSANNNGVWSDTPRTISVHIKPPLWASWWAIAMYATLAWGMCLFTYIYLRSRHEWKNKLLMQEMERQNDKRLEEMKMNFYLNIAHELKTPLSLITAPLNDLRKKCDDDYTHLRLELIEKNRRNLHKRINQLLEMRRDSIDAIQMSVGSHDVHVVMVNIINLFLYQSEKNGIRLKYTTPVDNFTGWFDLGKIESVLINFITNAFKFTPPGGYVEVVLRHENNQAGEWAVISVIDSGVGMEESEIPRIFDMFYHGTPLQGNSNGMGLSFSKVIAEQHGGMIDVKSRHGFGSTFTLHIRIDRDFYKTEHLVADDDPDPAALRHAKTELPQADARESNQYTILVIEDNEDMLAYMTDSLKNNFNILTAPDGEAGLASAVKNKPDLIITDMMMPHVDGMELIRRLKSNTGTAHIPVIVHSINSDKESIRETFMAGAQEYIVKPFDADSLIMRIMNQLNSRNYFARRVRSEKLLVPSDITIPSEEERLLGKIREIMELNMSDSAFGVDELANSLNMTRNHLYRRLKSLSIDMNAMDIIRNFRMQRAAQLLATGQLLMTEVMYETGMTNHSRFKQYFKEVHGMTPREYANQFVTNISP